MPTPILRVRLEMDIEEFSERTGEFLAATATALDVALDQVQIVDIRTGCVIVVLLIPDATHERLSKEGHSQNWSDLLGDLYLRFPVSQVALSDEPELVNVHRAVRLGRRSGRDEGRFDWIHISDIHFRADDGATRWDQDAVLYGFRKALPTLLGETGVEPDAIFLTGDVSQSADPAEYDVALEFLRDLKGDLGDDDVRLFVVPGNHDVAWAKIDPSFDDALRTKLVDLETVNRLLLEKSTQQERSRLLERLEPFREFCRKCAALSQPPLSRPKEEEGLFFVEKFTHGQHRIGVAGLNSAWLSTAKKKTSPKTSKDEDDPDYGALFLGRVQVHDAMRELDDCDATFALLHHPPETRWFHDAELDVHRQHLARFDFILRGHEHVAEAVATSRGAPKATHRIAAGALHQDSRYKKSFVMGSLDFRQAVASLFFWAYEREKWDADTEAGHLRGYTQFRYRPEAPRRSRVH